MWARDLIGTCKASEVKVFMKQLGKRVTGIREAYGSWDTFLRRFPQCGEGRVSGANPPSQPDAIWLPQDSSGGDPDEWPNEFRIREFPTV